MKKTAIGILIAVLVVVIGGVLLFAGLNAVKFNFRNLDGTEYMTNNYDFTQSVRRIDVKGHTADVELLPSADGLCHVSCFESDREKYTVTVADGCLTIRPADRGARGFRFFSFKSPRITISLPAASYDLLKVELSTGDVTADKALSFAELTVETSTGDLTKSGVQAETVTVHDGTGDIRLSSMSPKTAELTLSTGKIELADFVCSGDLNCSSSTGDIRLTNVDAANLYLSASTGDITGTILTDKTFVATTSTGDVRVPTGTAGGRCEAHTTTGDVRLSVSGK